MEKDEGSRENDAERHWKTCESEVSDDQDYRAWKATLLAMRGPKS